MSAAPTSRPATHRSSSSAFSMTGCIRSCSACPTTSRSIPRTAPARCARGSVARVGTDTVSGSPRHGMAGWWREGSPADQVPQITVQDLHRELDTLQLIDVRQPGEREQGYIAGSVLKPLPKLTQSLDGM